MSPKCCSPVSKAPADRADQATARLLAAQTDWCAGRPYLESALRSDARAGRMKCTSTVRATLAATAGAAFGGYALTGPPAAVGLA